MRLETIKTSAQLGSLSDKYTSAKTGTWPAVPAWRKACSLLISAIRTSWLYLELKMNLRDALITAYLAGKNLIERMRHV